MKGVAVDRVTDLLLLAAGLAVVWQGASLVRPASPADPLSSGLSAPVPAEAAPPAELDRARVMVDGNAPGAREAAELLARRFPASPEAWILLARFREGAGEEGGAATAWARAVRLDPALADAKSPRFLGARMGALAERELARLRGIRRERALSPDEGGELEAVYYLRRRLAGGCE